MRAGMRNKEFCLRGLIRVGYNISQPKCMVHISLTWGGGGGGASDLKNSSHSHLSEAGQEQSLDPSLCMRGAG